MIPANHVSLSTAVQASIADPNVAAILARSFLGLNLGFAAFGPNGFVGVGYLILPVLSVILQLAQQVMAMPRVQDPQQKAMSQALLVMPLVFAYISFTFPMGAVFYWVVGSIIGIIQQYFIAGWGSLANYLPFLPPDKPRGGVVTVSTGPDGASDSMSPVPDAPAAPLKTSFWEVLQPLEEVGAGGDAAQMGDQTTDATLGTARAQGNESSARRRSRRR
jgi:YidC/Oxa1 family membrane protein insertase